MIAGAAARAARRRPGSTCCVRLVAFTAPIPLQGGFAMSPYNPGASTAGASQPATPDTQTLIGLLGNLMPLLLQIQSQSREQIFQPGPIQPGLWQSDFLRSAPAQPLPGPLMPGQLNSAQSGLEGLFGNVAPANPMLDQQAAVNLVEDI